MSKYLLEIGTEELPYRFIPQAIEQLKDGFKKFFGVNEITYGNIEVLATPRRLAVIVSDLAEKQPDIEKILKGPIKKVAYDENGNLTQAGKGFLAKNGVDEKDAPEKSYIQDDYLHAKVSIKGKFTSELLQENVPQLVLKLQGPYFMRWAANEEKFSRPIRWIVSILGDKELPIKIVEVKSSKFSRGHRFTKDVKIEIKNADTYVEQLKQANVIVNQNERKALIIELAKKKADELGAYTKYDDDLLDEVTYLCEWPVPVVCDFDEKYLAIPEKVSVTVMASHQRYFALYKDNKLLNKFITITNFLGSDFENIKAGNERVVTARLEDAIFFVKEDTKKTLESYLEDLKGITFQKGLGSVYDKTQRIVRYSKEVAIQESLNYTSQQIKDVERTALLCKADLATKLVFEFPELQGFIGADYARISGENEKVCKGIKEHYYPLNAESEVSANTEGQIVGIIDKLDTICTVFLSGKIPTGSSDPLGVRRAALGVIKTVIFNNLYLNLNWLIGCVLGWFDEFKTRENSEDVHGPINEFFVQRLIIFLSDTHRKDVLEACSKSKNPLDDLCDFVKRVEFLSKIVEKPEFLAVNESANRISRILNGTSVGSVNPALFVHDCEKKLFEAVNKIKNDSYEILFEGLIQANPAIVKFFDDVLVMDKDEKIKQNRLAMLSMLKEKYDLIADFSALQI